jgi:histidine triad (HIT) family protein
LTEPTCLFCRIARGEIPADRVLDTDDLVAFRDLEPRAPVHILIVPRAHIASLNEIEERDAELMGRLHVAARLIAEREGLAQTGWRIVINVGEDAGQSVGHLHLHLLGGRSLSWPPG